MKSEPPFVPQTVFHEGVQDVQLKCGQQLTHVTYTVDIGLNTSDGNSCGAIGCGSFEHPSTTSGTQPCGASFFHSNFSVVTRRLAVLVACCSSC